MEKNLLAISTIYNDKIHLPATIRKEFKFKNKDKIAWYETTEGWIVLEKVENKNKEKDIISY